MNMLDLKPFFKSIQDEIYCIVKVPDHFPNYYKGSDLDLFCYDINNLGKRLIAIGHTIVSSTIEIKITINNDYQQVYIDFINSGCLEFRFDLYSQLPNYKKLNIKQALFESIIENRIKKEMDSIYYFVPNAIDDAVVRYIEYHEWYSQRPDKIKHVDIILSKFSNEDLYVILSKLHHYISLPQYTQNEIAIEQKKHILILQIIIKTYCIFLNLVKKIMNHF